MSTARPGKHSVTDTKIALAFECPLSGVKQTWAIALQTSTYDPKRTLEGISVYGRLCAHFSLAVWSKVLGFRHSGKA